MLRLTVTAAALVLTASAALAQPAPDRSYCEALRDQYDRLVPRVEGWTPPGRIAREVGMERCRRGDVADGERILQEAIRANGYEPVARPATR